MKIRIECVMVGGPEHGRVLVLRQDAARPCRPAVVALDGQLCVCAARRHSHRGATRCMLMHPQASGAQLLEVLAACAPGHAGSGTRRRRNPGVRAKSNPTSTRFTETAR